MVAKYLTKILKVSIFFLLPAFLYILIIRGNIFFLATLQTTRDVGLFNSALTVMSVFLVLVSLFTYVFYTSITRAALQPKNQQAMKFIVKYLLLLSLPAVSVLIFLSEHIMQLTFGTEYVVAGTALAIMSAALPVLFLNAVLQIMLLALDLEKLLTTIIGCVALITVGASYFLISQYGIDGAAAATVIAEVLIFSISLYYVRRAGIKFSADLTVLRIIFANVFFALVLAALPAPWLFKLIASILVYTICVLLLGILTRADLQWFSEVRALNGIINRVKSTRLEKWFFRE